MQVKPLSVLFLEAINAALETLVQHIFIIQWHPEKPVFSLVDKFIKLVDCLLFLKFDRLGKAKSIVITHVLQTLDTLHDLLEVCIDSHTLEQSTAMLEALFQQLCDRSSMSISLSKKVCSKFHTK